FASWLHSLRCPLSRAFFGQAGAGARNAGAFRLELRLAASRASAAAIPGFQRYDTTADRGSASIQKSVAGPAADSGRPFGPALAPHGTCSAPLPSHRAMSGTAVEPLTWPPRGRWSRTRRVSRKAGFRPGNLPAKSAPYLARRVYQIKQDNERDPVPTRPGRRRPPRPGGRRACRTAARRLPPVPAQGGAEVAGLQDRAQRAGAGERWPGQARDEARGWRPGADPADSSRRTGRPGCAGEGPVGGDGGQHRVRG